ncbi:hypothetical protein BDV12DRAFT_188622 [Aspergillus spectabilis]
MAESEKNVALVFGASGISGWAVTKNLLSYPFSTTFSRIIALTHPSVKEQLQSKVPRLDEVTHVHYLAYANATAYPENVMDIKDISVGMTSNAVHAVHAVDQLCKSLKQPPNPLPYGDEIFYYARVDLIKEAAQGKQWRWCEVRPDQIIGHVPAVTSMTCVKSSALYLALYRYVNGSGAQLSLPGHHRRSEIYLSIAKPEEANGEGFNIADTATPGSWSVKWPILAEYFGLVGTGPAETDAGWGKIDVWWTAHQDEYRKLCEEYGLKGKTVEETTWVFVKAGLTLLDRTREMSLDKIRSGNYLRTSWSRASGSQRQ